jgi:hypothetical protein
MEIGLMHTDGSSDIKLNSSLVIMLPRYGLLLGEMQTEEEPSEVVTKSEIEETTKKVSCKIRK